MTAARELTLDELKELAHGQVRSLCQHLLPNGRENCGYWEVGSIEGEPGQSLKVNLGGGRPGLWTDFSAPQGSPERAGNMIQLVALVQFGGRLGDAIKWTRSWLGLDHLDRDRLVKEKARARKSQQRSAKKAEEKAELNRRRAQQLYLEAVPAGGTPVETYLKGRAIDLAARGMEIPGSIRFHPQVYCAEIGKPLPAMVACIYHVSGTYLGTHRTWLQPDGQGKAALVEAKKSIGKYLGGYIQLWKGEHRCALKDLPAGTPIHVSEGIEDGLSAAIMRRHWRVLAGVSLSNIGAIALPPDCPVHLLAQRDEKQQAIDAFEKAVVSLQERGHEVFLLYPPDGVKDWNDALRRELVGGV